MSATNIPNTLSYSVDGAEIYEWDGMDGTMIATLCGSRSKPSVRFEDGTWLAGSFSTKEAALAAVAAKRAAR